MHSVESVLELCPPGPPEEKSPMMTLFTVIVVNQPCGPALRSHRQLPSREGQAG
jgi:hypothetical protein